MEFEEFKQHVHTELQDRFGFLSTKDDQWQSDLIDMETCLAERDRFCRAIIRLAERLYSPNQLRKLVEDVRPFFGSLGA